MRPVMVSSPWISRTIVSVTLALLLVGARESHSPHSVAAAGRGLHVEGNRLVDDAGETVRLLGVNRASAEYACIQGWGIFEGPTDTASVDAMRSWHINAVRIPLNEQCWLGIGGVEPRYGGVVYQQAIAQYVSLLNENGIYVILDLHWAAPGIAPATEQRPMANREHSPAFWTSIADSYKANTMVLFDLYNEPYPDANQDTPDAWRCWRDGGFCRGVGYEAAGMQELVNAVRATGATNVILAGGVAYAGHLSRWRAYAPEDPLRNLAAAVHIYAGSQCNTVTCWDTEIAELAREVPVVGGEIGQNDCRHDFIDQLMPWMDAHGISYLGWGWNRFECSGPALITDYDGTPTEFGRGFRDHLAALVGSLPSPLVTAVLRPRRPAAGRPGPW